MIRAGFVLAWLTAACSGDDDPCAGASTCVRLDVESATVERIDLLELDVVYDGRHATTTTQAGGGHTTALPLSTAIVLDDTGSDPIAVGIVAAGKLGASVLGTGAASTTVAPGRHVTVALELSPTAACNAGARYCGGDMLAGDPQTLYACNAGGVPIARGVCPAACSVRPGKDDVCLASGGSCRDGGSYCGGDKLDGDPQTLYRCMAGVATTATPCPSRCIVRPSDDDVCQ
jgi:hypothetical protein